MRNPERPSGAGATTNFADPGAVGMQHRGHQPAEPELLVIGRPAAPCDTERQQQTAKQSQRMA